MYTPHKGKETTHGRLVSLHGSSLFDTHLFTGQDDSSSPIAFDVRWGTDVPPSRVEGLGYSVSYNISEL